MKSKVIPLITSLSLAVTGITPITAGSFASAESADDTVKIMSIGDSITDGYGIGGSYRKFLYHGLTEKGISVDMVGAKGGGWTPVYTDETTGESFSYDDENTGYSGYAIMDYSGRNGIYETLQSTGCLSTEPDIVILQIGTNDVIDCHDLDSSGERLTVLIEYILSNISPESALFVTSIPDLDPNRSDVYDWFGSYRHSADWQTFFTDEEVEVNVQASVDKYNSIVRETVTKLSSSHSNLFLGDINSVITDVTSQLNDGVHPNNTGYKLMGEYWTDIVYDYLTNGSQPVTGTTTTSTTTSTTTTTTTTTTTSSATTTTTTTTTTDTETTSTTTTVPGPVTEFRMADLVKLSNYLLGRENSLTAEERSLYDLDGNSALNGFDLALLRKAIISSIANAGPYIQ